MSGRDEFVRSVVAEPVLCVNCGETIVRLHSGDWVHRWRLMAECSLSRPFATPPLELQTETDA